MLDKAEGRIFRKIVWGIINWPMMNKLQILCFGYLNLKTSLRVLGKYAKQRKKPEKSPLILNQNQKILKSFFYNLM
jgi:hypothetical protein